MKRPAKCQQKDTDGRKDLVSRDDQDTSDEDKDDKGDRPAKRPATHISSFDLRGSKT